MRARLTNWLVVLLPGLLGLATAAYASDGTAHFVAQLLLIGMFAAAFDLAYGVTGIFSFGHAAFFGGGAYAYAILTTVAHWGFGGAIVGSAVVGGLLALIFGSLAFRTSGLFFALATLAFGQLVNILIEIKLRDWSGGSDGLSGVPRPFLFGREIASTNAFLAFASVCFVLVMGFLVKIRASSYGQVLRAVRDNPVRAAQLGYNVITYRLSAYVVSGALSGIAGALFASLTMFVSPDLTRWTMSGDILIMTVLGGAGTLAGPLLGVTLFEVAKEVISRYTDHWYGILGVLFVACTLFLPGGLQGLISDMARRWRARKLGPTEYESGNAPADPERQ